MYITGCWCSWICVYLSIYLFFLYMLPMFLLCIDVVSNVRRTDTLVLSFCKFKVCLIQSRSAESSKFFKRIPFSCTGGTSKYLKSYKGFKNIFKSHCFLFNFCKAAIPTSNAVKPIPKRSLKLMENQPEKSQI